MFYRKTNHRFMAFLLAMILLFVTFVGCRKPDAPKQEETSIVQENNTEKESEELIEVKPEKVKLDLPYNDGEFLLTDENGNIIRNNRSFEAENGVVSTSKYEVSSVGKEIIEKGGNAVDAAVACGFALGVAEPQASGVGGGGFLLIKMNELDKPVYIDFRDTAPASATLDKWEYDENGKLIGNKHREGATSCLVPGNVSGLLHALDNYGTMTRQEVMQPAIDLANKGILVSHTLAKDISDNYERIIDNEEMSKIYTKDGLPLEEGDILINKDLGKTLQKIADEGQKGFYEGEIAKAIADSVQSGGGFITESDLKNYKFNIRDTVHSNYRGYDVVSISPPSFGGPAIIEILNIIENFDVASMEVNSPEYISLLTSAFRLAFADRFEYMGDPLFVEVPLEGLTSKEYAKSQAERIDLTKIVEYEAGDPYALEKVAEHNEYLFAKVSGDYYESPSTTHVSIGDKEGNIVALTQTMNAFFGSQVIPTGTGFCMNNQMSGFSFNEESPNKLEPGKTPLSSMSPTIVLKDNEPVLVIGSPGSRRIVTTIPQIISKVIDHSMNVQEAIDAPRFFTDVDQLFYEERIPQETIDKLAEMGAENIEKYPEWDLFFGGAQGIQYLENGKILGGADSRRDGKALGY